MNILLVEDDQTQMNWLKRQLSTWYKDANFVTASSECEFYSLLDARTEVASVHLAIFDMRLPWSRKGAVESRSAEHGDPAQAGVRCCFKLREAAETSQVPAVIYTVQTDEDADEPEKLRSQGIALITKRPKTDALRNAIEKALGNTR